MTDGYVIIVESGAEVGRPLADALGAQGYEVALFATAQGALRALGQRTPCLILVGTLDPPEARQLIRALRGRHRAIPTVMIATASSLRREDPAPTETEIDTDRDLGDGLPFVDEIPEELMRIVERFCPPPLSRAVVH